MIFHFTASLITSNIAQFRPTLEQNRHFILLAAADFPSVTAGSRDLEGIQQRGPQPYAGDDPPRGVDGAERVLLPHSTGRAEGLHRK